MKRTITVCALFGIVAAAAVILHDALQYTKATQAAYRRGWNEGMTKAYQEATAKGHGFWKRGETGATVFQWNPSWNADHYGGGEPIETPATRFPGLTQLLQ